MFVWFNHDHLFPTLGLIFSFYFFFHHPDTKRAGDVHTFEMHEFGGEHAAHDPGAPHEKASPSQGGETGGVHTLDTHVSGAEHAAHDPGEPHDRASPAQGRTGGQDESLPEFFYISEFGFSISFLRFRRSSSSGRARSGKKSK